jgi:hypothetical protein
MLVSGPVRAEVRGVPQNVRAMQVSALALRFQRRNSVNIPLVRRLLLAAVVAGLLISFGTGPQSVSGSQIAIPNLQAITESIATAAHYPANTIEITSSPVRFRISIRDAQLAVSDEGTRNAAAAALAASEQVLSSHPEFSMLEAISVAIIHGNASADGTAAKDWHIEDVVEFRTGPSGRFSMHIT